MPPAALISSTRMRMPFTAALEKLTIGPDRSCAVPITISLAVTPCCASAGAAANNASVTMARDFMDGFSPDFCGDGPGLSGPPTLLRLTHLKDVDAGHKGVYAVFDGLCPAMTA